MKRSTDLIVQILLYAEEHADNGESRCVPKFENATPPIVDYHIMLCEEAGLLRSETAKCPQGSRKPVRSIIHLTWDGHEFLDQHRPKR